MPWSIVSNAAERSNKTEMTSPLLSVALNDIIMYPKESSLLAMGLLEAKACLALDGDYLTPNNDGGLDKPEFFQ